MNIEEYLQSLETFGIKLGLSQTTELMTRAGYCIENGSKPYFIHIAGSNGKGSVGAMIQHALHSAGMKVGFYTSPHLAFYNERIRINGVMISDDELDVEFRQLYIHAEEMKKEGKFVTYFEFTTILALGYFLHNDVDFIVWETGMGGRFDSTNIIIPAVSVITNIALEHCQYLGDTLEKIAFEKGGIIKENIPVFCGMMPENAGKTLQNIAEEKNAQFNIVKSAFPTTGMQDGLQMLATPSGMVKLNLSGEMQRKNFTLVYGILQYLSSEYGLDMDKMLASMNTVSWPGRFQITAEGDILDGGHNPDGILALTTALREIFPQEKFTFVFASFEDKDTAACLELLLPLAQKFCFVPLAAEHRPSCPPERLCKMIRNFDGNYNAVHIFSSLDEYLDSHDSDNSRKVFCGSLYLLGEYFRHHGFEMLNKI